jgi:3-oxoacyl-[acyl-carrier protein] reductase
MKVAIMTGDSRGIGAAVAERLAGDGFTVVISYSASAAPAEALARDIEAKGGRQVRCQCSRRAARVFDAAWRSAGSMCSPTMPVS